MNFIMSKLGSIRIRIRFLSKIRSRFVIFRRSVPEIRFFSLWSEPEPGKIKPDPVFSRRSVPESGKINTDLVFSKRSDPEQGKILVKFTRTRFFSTNSDKIHTDPDFSRRSNPEPGKIHPDPGFFFHECRIRNRIKSSRIRNRIKSSRIRNRIKSSRIRNRIKSSLILNRVKSSRIPESKSSYLKTPSMLAVTVSLLIFWTPLVTCIEKILNTILNSKTVFYILFCP